MQSVFIMSRLVKRLVSIQKKKYQLVGKQPGSSILNTGKFITMPEETFNFAELQFLYLQQVREETGDLLGLSVSMSR